jgi:hypothetical protein
MKRQHLFICTDRTKSWASAFDYAIKIAETNGCTKIILVSKGNFFPNSQFFRNRILKKIARENLLTFQLYKLSIFYKFFSGIRALSFVFSTKLSQKLVRVPFQDHKLSLICKAYWGARYGSQSFHLRDIAVRDLFRAVFDCELYSRFLQSKASKIIFSQKDFLDAYIWNGREPAEATLLLFLIRNSIKYNILERGSRRDTYELWTISPHSSKNWWIKLEENWKRLESQGFPESDFIEAQKYAEEKSKGFDLRSQQKWFLLMGARKSFVHKNPYLAFFTSSTKEMSPFVEFETVSPFGNQIDSVLALVEIAKNLKLDLVIKRHPYSVSKDGVDQEKSLWREFEDLPNVFVVHPEHEIDSYQIAEGALFSFVWISSVGFDLIYRGLSVKALGPAYWAYKNTYRVNSKDDITKSITEKFTSKDRDELIFNYGNLMTNAGTKNTYFYNISKSGVWLKSTNRRLAANDWQQFKEFLNRIVSQF